MSTTAGSADAGVATDERQRELQAFDDTKAGVKGLVDEVVAQVRAAAEAVGFFQVVNHGVPGELMDAMLAGIKRFNEAANWRDTLFCELAPVPPSPEELPDAVRGVMMEYSDAVTKVAMRVLELLSESLGLPSAHLREMGCAEGLNVVSHYSPPCPEPHLTLGTSTHTDPAFLTVLLQDGVGGLQVLVDRRGGRKLWVDVPPLPGALIINIGDLLQLVSNDKFRSVEHRVLANRSRDTPRLSVASFFNTDDKKRLYGPITVGSSDLPVYRSVTALEYFALFYRNGLQGRLLDYFRLQH
ncbi:hypothetical protein HU200_057447 [Digitaria exilis]|uniref:Fe2OG dioxygenase domain-containing protein n=1 Tax=Digitaria exilis TaxID=1010633 RepID=A0A835E4E0_9POAL|nr:hypothetical protein HU200_057447 [Digitaria exilis]